MAAARTSNESGQAAATAAATPPPTDTFPFAAPSARAPRWRSASHGEAHGGKPLDILERPRDKTRGAEVSLDALQFLFAEMVTYAQSRVSGIAEFERLLACMGYRVGERALAMITLRNESASNPKNPRRETRLLPALLWVNNTFWKAVFGAPADSLERSTESGRGDEYMITSQRPLFSRGISIPKEMTQLSVEAFTAGIVEAALEGLGFPARVTAHSVPTDQYPHRTTILIKLDHTVMEREASLGGP